MARRARRWVAATVGFGVACLGIAVWLGWWGAALFGEADEYYRTQTAVELTPADVDRYYGSLMQASYAMHDVVGPLLAGALFATLATIALLTLAWERREASGS